MQQVNILIKFTKYQNNIHSFSYKKILSVNTDSTRKKTAHLLLEVK